MKSIKNVLKIHKTFKTGEDILQKYLDRQA